MLLAVLARKITLKGIKLWPLCAHSGNTDRMNQRIDHVDNRSKCGDNQESLHNSSSYCYIYHSRVLSKTNLSPT